MSSVTVISGGTVTAPSTPTKSGCTFGGWYKDISLREAFTFGTAGDKITGAITLYAKWIETDRLRAEAAIQKVSIGYQSGDSASRVTKNLTLPTRVNASGDVSITWSSNTTSAISNTGAVTRPSNNNVSVILTATVSVGTVSRSRTFNVTVIHEETSSSSSSSSSGYTVSFDSNGGSAVASVNVLSGGTVATPDNPTRAGYVFAGWYKDNALTTAFTFGTNGDKITKNTTLFARWIKSDTLRAEYALGEIVIGYADGDNPRYVTQNLTLPSKVSMSGDVNITWSSTNSSVISSAGTVTRPSGSDTNVTLTARAVSGTESSTRNFSLNVIRARSRVSSDVAVVAVQDAGSGDLSITYKASSDQIIDIEGNYSRLTIRNADDALDAIQAIHGSLGINNPYNELQTFLATSDDYGSEYSFQQVYKGVKVYGRSVMASTNASGEGDFLHSSFLATSVLDSADMRINLTASQAEARAKSAYSRDVEVDTARTERVVYSLESYDNAPVYAYIVRVYSTSGDNYVDDDVFVNADTGENIISSPNSRNAFEMYRAEGWNEFHRLVSFDVIRGIVGYIPHMSYVMHDPNLHILVNNFTRFLLIPVNNQFNTWTDTQQVTVYSNMREIMSWWQEKFGRYSIDGKGTTVDIVTHSIGKKDNAEWNYNFHRIYVYDLANTSSYDHFCGSAVDFLTHETTHGVMQYVTGGLPYKDATGAIDEGYADTFACIKDENWKFGEDLFDTSNPDCDRNIADPFNENSRTKPIEALKTPTEYIYSTYKYNLPDHNRVHQRSFKVSHAAYLMHVSNDINNGLTWDELGKVWYKSMHMGLSAASKFEDVRRCVLWAAQEIKLPTNKLAAIKSAFDEVGITASSVNAKLSGTVTDYDTGNNILGVSVFLFDGRISGDVVVGKLCGSRTTNSAGRYSLECETGVYPVVMVDERYVTFMGLATVNKSEDVRLDVRLVRPGNGSLSGKAMKSGDKTPLQGVTVNVCSGWYVQTASAVQTTSTDTNGQYSFASLNNGYYTVELRKSGYKTATFNVTISGDVTGQDWYMSEGSDDLSYDIPIDKVHFPDDNFRAYISRAVDNNYDGILSRTEIENTTRINVIHSYITSLKGIEYFTALISLDCYNNQLTTLDLSHNTALKWLNCSYNKLTALNLQHNTSLTWLYCNDNQLTVLDLRHNTALMWVDCEYNQLIAFDLSHNIALTYLDCHNNKLTALDLKLNTALKSLHCGYNQLTVLELSYNIALTYLNCYVNKLTALDLRNCPNLNSSNVVRDSSVNITWPTTTTSTTSAVSSPSGQSVSASSAHEILAVLPPFTPSRSGTYSFTASLDREPPETSSLLFLSNSEDLSGRFSRATSPDWVSVSADFTAGRTYYPVIAAKRGDTSGGGCNSATLGIIFMAGVALVLVKRL